jgi:hypothetical protein
MSYNAWPTTGTGYYQGFVRSPRIELILFHPSSPPSVSPQAEAVVASPIRGYYVLTADGAVEAHDGALSFGSAPVPTGLARAMAVMPDGLGYAVLDGHGAIYLFGSARHLKIDPSITWPRSDIARGLVITPSGEGYAVLDNLGGVHPTGDAPPAPPRSGPQGDVARALAITPSGHGYAVLDGDGTIHPSGDAPPAPSATGPWPGFDFARALLISPSGHGYAMLDELGDITTYGDARAAPPGEPTLARPMGTWTGLTLLPDGRYVVLRADSFSSTW